MSSRLIPTGAYQRFLWEGEPLCFYDSPRRMYVPARVAHRDLTVLPSCLKGSRLPGKPTAFRGRHGTGGIIVYYPKEARRRLRCCLDSIRRAQWT